MHWDIGFSRFVLYRSELIWVIMRQIGRVEFPLTRLILRQEASGLAVSPTHKFLRPRCFIQSFAA